MNYRHSLTALLIAASCCTLQAQRAGDDYTHCILNPGFEESFTFNGNISSGAHTIDTSTGWIFEYDTNGGWLEFQTAAPAAEPVAEGSLMLSFWNGAINLVDLYQTITGLPAGCYTLSAYLRVASGAQDVYQQHVYVETPDSAYRSPYVTEKGSGVNWEQVTTPIFFVDSSDDEIRIGVRSVGDGASSLGIFHLDGFYLEYVGDLDDDRVVINKELATLNLLRDKLEDYINSPDMEAYSGLTLVLYDVLDSTLDIDEDNLEAILAEQERIKEAIAHAEEGVKLARRLEIMINNYGALTELAYDGLAAFQQALDVAIAIYEAFDVTTYEGYAQAIVDLEAAYVAYNLSQQASAEAPADYTFLLSAPSFYDEFCGLSIYEMNGDNRDVWGNEEGWIRTGNYGHADYLGDKICWSSWGAWFGTMTMKQELTDVPNGYYSVTCLAAAIEGEITNQRLFAKGFDTSYSPIMTIGGDWNFQSWETMTTAIVAVIDGKLTIGFTSDNLNGGSTGWYCVADFKLNYHGPITEEQFQSLLTDKVKSAEATKCNLRGDYAPLQGAIEVAKTAATTEEIIAAADTLDKAVLHIEASNKAYQSFVDGIMADTELSASTLYGTPAEMLYNVIGRVWEVCAADTTTSRALPFLEQVLHNYDAFAIAITEYEMEVEMLIDDEVQKWVDEYNATLQQQLEYANTYFASGDILDEYVLRLAHHIQAIKAYPVCKEAAVSNGEEVDMTDLIMNPDAESEMGWIFNKGTGNTHRSQGNHYSGDPNWKYFDSWNPTPGKLNFRAHQVVRNVPNGTYRLEFAIRTDCTQGIVVYTATGNTSADTLMVSGGGANKNPEPKYDADGNVVLDENGEPEHEYSSLYWGGIWEQADEGSAEKLANNGYGHGWNAYKIEDIKVTNHQLTIGITTDSLLTNIPFDGCWFSVADFKLILVSYDANNEAPEEWVTEIKPVGTDDLVVKAENGKVFVLVNGNEVADFKVYTLAGSPVLGGALTAKGVYFVQYGDMTRKLIVK
ncbi:MAG: hypothetical protein IKV15_01975 [Bacteroidaceae bacterium]|nr:hypothetical protein [Bacteroidaceae bacterium]